MFFDEIELTREELKDNADMQDARTKIMPLSPFSCIVHEAGIPLKQNFIFKDKLNSA